MRTCFGRATRIAAVVAVIAVGLASSVPSAESAGTGGPPTVLLSGNPGMLAINAATDTVYVPIQTGGVEVVNGADCNARASEGCTVVATIPTGDSLAAVVDPLTDTVYVVSGNDIWVVDGAHCNGRVTTGCDKQLATIRTAGGVEALALDLRTATLYMASMNGVIFVSDVAKCSTLTTSGCSARTKEIKDPFIPVDLSVDLNTNTVYAANNGLCEGTTELTTCQSGTGDTVSVIDGATCNGLVSTGCRQKPALITVGEGAGWTELDEATKTLYVASMISGTVSVVNVSQCNGHLTSGCRPAATFKTGLGAAYVVVDQPLHTLFTVNYQSDTLTETDVLTCNGKVTSGCTVFHTQQAGPILGAYSNPTPNDGVLDLQTGTLYITCEGGSLFITALNVNR